MAANIGTAAVKGEVNKNRYVALDYAARIFGNGAVDAAEVVAAAELFAAYLDGKNEQ